MTINRTQSLEQYAQKEIKKKGAIEKMSNPRDKLKEWLLQELALLGGSAPYIEVYKAIWNKHKISIDSRGDEWKYRWQYELSHAASNLRKGSTRKLQNQVDDNCPKGIWALK